MRVSVSFRRAVSAASSGAGAVSSARKWPNSDSSSSPTGFSSETGACALRLMCSTSVGSSSSSTRDLLDRRLAAELAEELALDAPDLVQLLDDVHRHADRARLVGERPRHRLADPPGRVGRELEALAVVELLRRAHEPDRPLLDQVEEGQALVAVVLGDRDDQAQVRLDHLLLRRVVAALDALGELDLLGGRQQRHLADVLEEELERVRRDLARFGLEVEAAPPRRARPRPRCGAPRAPCRTRRAAAARGRRPSASAISSCVRKPASWPWRTSALASSWSSNTTASLPFLSTIAPNPLLLNVAGSRNLSTAALRRICRMRAATLARLPDVRYGPEGPFSPRRDLPRLGEGLRRGADTL